MPLVYLALGSNIGNKQDNVNQAIYLLSNSHTIQKISPIYLTEPVGGVTQEWFLNCAVEIITEIQPLPLLSSLKSIERKMGRTRTVKNGPRIIDIDILFYGNQIIHTKKLTIPHPFLQERLFVLKPMMDINPLLFHPVLKKTIQELYTNNTCTEKVIPFK